MPSNVDGTVQWHGRTYFFKQGQYWQLNDEVGVLVQFIGGCATEVCS